MKRIAYVFSGQGSQKKGMGKTLFDKYSKLVAQTDSILGYSIKELCLEDPGNLLNLTKYTQPAIYAVNALSYLDEIDGNGKIPDYTAGHSVGEYNALLAAGAFDYNSGLKLVKKRGELMSKALGGGMAAVVGLTKEDIDRVITESNLKKISIANYNSPTQIVISGEKDKIVMAQTRFENAGAKKYVMLPVSGAFHTEYMEEAKKEFEAYIEEFSFTSLNIPVISNLTARPYHPNKIKETLLNQMTGAVQWTECVRFLMEKGVKEFKEIGNENILTGLIKMIQKDAVPLEIEEKNKDIVIFNAEPEERRKIQSRDEKFKTKKTPVKSTNGEAREDALAFAKSLGDDSFKKDYGIKYAYMAGAMYRGIASTELVIRLGKAKLFGFFGTGGLSLEEIEKSIIDIKRNLSYDQMFGMNLLSNASMPQREEKTVDIFLKHDIKFIEASAFMQITPALVKYRLKGLARDEEGVVYSKKKIMAKISRPEIAAAFLSPPPETVLKKLFEEEKISNEEYEMSQIMPMCDDLCAEADSGGHTDQAPAYTLLPTILKLRDVYMEKFRYRKKIRVGAAGGIGTAEAAAAAFILGADFILTGSINQCTVEAGISNEAKDLLQNMNIQDTAIAPSGDMFELGAKIQVLNKGTFFPARANKLYDLYLRYNSIDEIDEKTRNQIQEKYFQRTFEEVFQDAKDYFAKIDPKKIEKAERNPKYKMALVFKGYFYETTRSALEGDKNRINYQIHCGPSLGAFNQSVKGSYLEDWKNRHVDHLAEKLMHETASLLQNRYDAILKKRESIA